MNSSSVLLPFYGTKESDYSPFQYLPLEFDFGIGLGPIAGRGSILLPHWAVSREALKVGDSVNLQIGIAANGKTFSRAIVSDVRPDDALDGIVYDLDFSKDNLKPFFVLLHAGSLGENNESANNASHKVANEGAVFRLDLLSYSSARDLLLASIKDCWMLKRGICIYLNHLIPYFSRITNFPKEEYPLLRETLLKEPIKRTELNATYLESLFDEMSTADEIHSANNSSGSILPGTFDLNAFASSLSSELELDLFSLSFDSELAITYLKSIKNLEGRLFFNHNVVLALYTQELLQ